MGDLFATSLLEKEAKTTRPVMFRAQLPFDPLLILLEIVVLQVVFYASFMMVVLVVDQVSGMPYSEEQLFNWAAVRFSSPVGCASIIGEVLAGFFTGLVYVLLEGRAKKALDFMATTFVVHLIVVSALSSLPKSWSWWLAYLATAMAGVFTAETVSLKLEMQPIVLDNGRVL